MLSGWQQKKKNMLKNKLQVGDQNESEANVYTALTALRYGLSNFEFTDELTAM